YVERNALRANLVSRAEDWRWSSLCERLTPTALPWLDAGPVGRGPDWLAYVNRPETEAELARLRRGGGRGGPYGGEGWVKETASLLGLEYTMRPPGRPRGRGGPEAGEEDLFGEKE